jgi:predicted acetyltransferase
MPHLITASMRVHRSFLAAMAEFQAEGRGGPGDDSNTGQAIRKYASRWADPAEFARYVQQLEGEARDQSPRRGGRVPQTTLWWVSEDEYLGRISIRHRLTAHLREIGGHIGYDIRPSVRQHGHATAMLAAALAVARSLGRESSEPELAGPFEFPALPSVVSRTADDEQYHGARRWPEDEQAS